MSSFEQRRRVGETRDEPVLSDHATRRTTELQICGARGSFVTGSFHGSFRSQGCMSSKFHLYGDRRVAYQNYTYTFFSGILRFYRQLIGNLPINIVLKPE